MRNIPKWQLEFFQNFTRNDLYNLIGVLIHNSSTESNIRFCSDNNHFCSERAWLRLVRETIKKLQGRTFLEIFQEFPSFPNIGLLKLLRRYFGDACISEEWGEKRLPQIQRIIRKYRRQHLIHTKDDWRNFPSFIEKEGLGKVKISRHAIEQFKKRVANHSPQSLIELFQQSGIQSLDERERKKREKKHGEGARFYTYPPEQLRFVVIPRSREEYGYDKWMVITVEVDTGLVNCLARHSGFLQF